MARLLSVLCPVFLVAACAKTESRVAPGEEAHATPPAVVEAAQAAVPGLVVTLVERDVEGGALVYEVHGTKDGESYEIEVTADGKVDEIEAGDDGEDDR